VGGTYSLLVGHRRMASILGEEEEEEEGVISSLKL
jgi:hypothetical protein